MKKTSLRQPLMLLLTSLIWGFAFVAQSVGMEHLGPFTFNGIRNIIGALVLIPCIFLLKKLSPNTDSASRPSEQERRTLLLGGLTCGTVFFFASNAQQIGIQYTTVGKAGFITALYIIIVPILGLFFRKRCGTKVWLGVLLALIGFYRLSIQGSISLASGDLWVLCSSLLFSIHILLIDYFSPKVDGVKLSCLQFLVCGVLSCIPMVLWEKPAVSDILLSWQPILYAGVLSCGVAYTLQILGQRNFNPTIASLILSLESVFSVLGGWLILHQALSTREISGCILIFCAIILAQLPERKK